MKQTNRRIDLEVEELTRRICFECKPLWERVWIKLVKQFDKLPEFFQVLFILLLMLGGVYYGIGLLFDLIIDI